MSARRILKPISDDEELEVVKEEMEISLKTFFILFFIMYILSYLFPGILFFAYVGLVFHPYFLRTTDFFSLFLELKPLLALITMPLVIIACYLVKILVIALYCRMLWSYTERKSPSKSGIIPRSITSKVAHYYFFRSFTRYRPGNNHRTCCAAHNQP